MNEALEIAEVNRREFVEKWRPGKHQNSYSQLEQSTIFYIIINHKMVTKTELKNHLLSMGWREDSTGNSFIGEFNNRKLRVVFKPRVFQMQENLIGKD